MEVRLAEHRGMCFGVRDAIEMTLELTKKGPVTVLGDLVSTGLGQLGLNWQASPALTELEEVCLDWWRQMLGLSERWSGVIRQAGLTRQ